MASNKETEDKDEAFDGMAFPELKKTIWKPGELVTFSTPVMPWLDAMFSSVWIALIFFGFGYWIAFKFADSFEDWDPGENTLFFVAFFFGLIGAFLGGKIQRWRHGPVDSKFDWNTRTITLLKRSKKLQILFSDVKSIDIFNDSKTVKQSQSVQKSVQHYRCKIFVTGSEFQELICQTKYFREDRDTPYRRARTVAKELSNRLSVTWRAH